MTKSEANDLAVKAEALGYGTVVKQLIGGSYRVYLTRTDGRWTFAGSEEDLLDVYASNNLWCSAESVPAFVQSGRIVE